MNDNPYEALQILPKTGIEMVVAAIGGLLGLLAAYIISAFVK